MLNELDVAFINPTHHGPDYYSPIGINILEQLAAQAGFRTQVIDFHRRAIEGLIAWPEGFFDEAGEVIRMTNARVFAFSVMNVGMPWATRLAQIARHHHPHSKIVFGGPHASLMGRQILEQFPVVDIIAVREGERVIVPLLRSLVQSYPELGEVPNLLFRDKGAIVDTAAAEFVQNLDEIPAPKLDQKLLNTAGIVSVEAGRGCPYRCNFCSSHSIWTRRPRFKSPAALADEAHALVSAGVGRVEDLIISFEHDDFLANRPWFLEFAKYKSESGMSFRYGITTRVNHINADVSKLLVDSGCISVFMGLETGSERLQSSSLKHLQLGDVMPRIRRLLSSGIHVSTNFIVGFPDETWEDIALSVRMMCNARWLGADVNISVMCPEPGSDLFLITPKHKHLLLLEGERSEELARGGIDVKRLSECESMHLVTIKSDAFDIVHVARLARTLQVLLRDYPITVAALLRESGFSFDVLCSRLREVTAHHGLQSRDVPGALLASFANTPDDAEVLLYEGAVAAKKEGATKISARAFRENIVERYLAMASVLREEAGYVSQEMIKRPKLIPIQAVV